jgi:hypothetical protein
MTEEERAAVWEAQQVQRAAAEIARQVQLQGNPVAARALRDQWQPVIDWLRERDS